MFHWDQAMKKARVSARLKALPPLARTSFAATSPLHAYGHVRVTPKWGRPDAPLEQAARLPRAPRGDLSARHAVRVA